MRARPSAISFSTRARASVERSRGSVIARHQRAARAFRVRTRPSAAAPCASTAPGGTERVARHPIDEIAERFGQRWRFEHLGHAQLCARDRAFRARPRPRPEAARAKRRAHHAPARERPRGANRVVVGPAKRQRQQHGDARIALARNCVRMRVLQVCPISSVVPPGLHFRAPLLRSSRTHHMKIFLDTADPAEIRETCRNRPCRRRHHQSLAGRQNRQAAVRFAQGDLRPRAGRGQRRSDGARGRRR